MTRTAQRQLSGYSWDTTGRVEAGVQALIGERLATLPSRAATVAARLREVTGDCRLTALYLRPDSPDTVVRLCEHLASCANARERARLQHEIGRWRFARPGTAEIHLTDDLEQVLAADDHRTRAYVPDPEHRSVIGALLDAFGTGFADFVESRHEVPGPNARLRQGSVKSWHLPNGTRVISKRANPAKPGRFIQEQAAYRAIATRIAGGIAFGKDRHLRLAPLLAAVRDGTSGHVYAVWQWVPGRTAESLLLAPGEHTGLLRDYRDLLDALLERGILWGDLSPRNILVHGRTHHLVDFEKTQVPGEDIPVPRGDRVAYCRGQIGVEELGVLCPQDEVRACLHGYLDPGTWDADAPGPVPFPPRPEVAAVLAGRGVTDWDLGTYNQADQQIWQVRSPDRDPTTGQPRYPGMVNFRVEHYLSCAGRTDADDYDRKTTEILIAGRRHGCFDDALQAVTDVVDEAERRFAVAEVAELLDGNDTGPVPAPHAAIRALVERIDALDTARHDPGCFRSACTTLGKDGR
ncbi:protein kinase family protein [Streptomyces acidiscabies]|uniref:Protein kinase domain-containing protein n=1 Tax=Streptomyces acidiscabies TaxID=42234 RepID=A0ABU4MGG8_9ACTN|nr:hypothetical protein [Streptomyces acidiscabies]MDX3025793.1 hypothetical protein [Streptomyces acidiscabies]